MTFTREDTFDKVAAIIAAKLNIDKSRVTGSVTLQDLGVILWTLSKLL